MEFSGALFLPKTVKELSELEDSIKKHAAIFVLLNKHCQKNLFFKWCSKKISFEVGSAELSSAGLVLARVPGMPDPRGF